MCRLWDADASSFNKAEMNGLPCMILQAEGLILRRSTLPETKRAPEIQWLKDEMSL